MTAQRRDGPRRRSSWPTRDGWRRLFRDRPLIPLTALLVVLVVLLELAQPGIVTADWVGVDDPRGDPAGDPRRLPDAGDADRRHRPVGRDGRLDGGVHHGHPDRRPGTGRRHRPRPCSPPLIAGLVNGIGIGIFKVHPLIMTLGIGLVILGLMNVYQLASSRPGPTSRDSSTGSAPGRRSRFLPNNLFLFVPLAALIILGLRYSGYGRLLFAVGDNPIAARLVRRPRLAGPSRAVHPLGAAGRDRRHPRRRPGQDRQPGRSSRSRAAVGGGRGHRRDVDHGRPRRLLRARSSGRSS